MDSSSSSSSSSSEADFHDFVNRMCNPASADPVRAIKKYKFPVCRKRTTEDQWIQIPSVKYPFMDKEAKDLCAADVPELLALYKQVITRYSMLSQALGHLYLTEDRLVYPFKMKSSDESLTFAKSQLP